MKKKFLQKFKDAYMNWQDAKRYNHDTTIWVHDVNLYEELGKELFCMSSNTIEKLEDKWLAEWEKSQLN